MGAEEVLTTSQVGASQVTTSRSREERQWDDGRSQGAGATHASLPFHHVKVTEGIVHAVHTQLMRYLSLLLEASHEHRGCVKSLHLDRGARAGAARHSQVRHLLLVCSKRRRE